MQKEQLILLAEKYLKGTATGTEQQQLHQWYDSWTDDEEQVLTVNVETSDTIKQRIFTCLQQEMHKEAPAPVRRVRVFAAGWFRYAAAVLLLVGGAAVWYVLSQHSPSLSSPETSISRIAPGTNRAVLTVGNEKIDLATDKTGIAVGNAIKYNDGEKIADAGGQLTLSTPRGGQYQAVLPDGSKVWLNAASSIRFPSRFKGNTREVEITGEAYLEVAKNTRQPFYVHTRKTDIQVLGTRFNIDAYDDESSVKTTLVEGSVKVKAGDRESILNPGEQAAITNDAQFIVQKADIDQTLAWKSGYFRFDEMPIDVIMRQLSRWYDIDVVYEGKITETFFAKVSRNTGIENVLKILEATGAVHFDIEGRKIKVRP